MEMIQYSFFFHLSLLFQEGKWIFVFYNLVYESLFLLCNLVEDILGFTLLFAYFPKRLCLSHQCTKQTSTTVHLITSWMGFALAISCLSLYINVTLRGLFQTFPVNFLALHFWYEKQPGFKITYFRIKLIKNIFWKCKIQHFRTYT